MLANLLQGGGGSGRRHRDETDAESEFTTGPASSGDAPSINTSGSRNSTSENATYDPVADDEEEVVRLNIGGIHYATTLETLTREPASLFQHLLKGGEEALKRYKRVARRLPSGIYFIDRDGELFAYVLDYLRNGKLLLPDNFKEMARLREEVLFYQLSALMEQLNPYYNLRYPTGPAVARASVCSESLSATVATPLHPPYHHPHDNGAVTTGKRSGVGVGTGIAHIGSGSSLQQTPTSGGDNNKMTAVGTAGTTTGGVGAGISMLETGGFITVGYRGTFAFGRDGQADVKFRKLHRILVCGKAQLCREVFGDTLNESRDPDREGNERYTARLYLKHQCLERACDCLAEKGFRLVTACSSGANGMLSAPTTAGGGDAAMNQRNSGDLEEQRWAHYTEYVFYREPQIFTMGGAITPNSQSPRS